MPDKKLTLISWLGSILSTCLLFVYSASLYSIITDARIPVKDVNDLLRHSYSFLTHEFSQTGRKEFMVRFNRMKIRTFFPSKLVKTIAKKSFSKIMQICPAHIFKCSEF